MRRLAAIGALAVALVAASVAFAAVGGGATRVSLAQATARTARVASQRYAFEISITRNGTPLTLHIDGAAAPAQIAVHLRMSNAMLPDGTMLPPQDGAEVLDGGFLYERAPSTVAILGKVRWLRIPTATLSPTSAALRTLHAMTPAPLLRVLAESHVRPLRSSRVFAGTVAYDDPIVRASVTALTGGIEFRHLRVTAWLGRDGLVHRLLLTGLTPDGSMSLRLRARLFALGRPVTVSPPQQGTYTDRQQSYLAE